MITEQQSTEPLKASGLVASLSATNAEMFEAWDRAPLSQRYEASECVTSFMDDGTYTILASGYVAA